MAVKYVLTVGNTIKCALFFLNQCDILLMTELSCYIYIVYYIKKPPFALVNTLLCHVLIDCRCCVCQYILVFRISGHTGQQ